MMLLSAFTKQHLFDKAKRCDFTVNTIEFLSFIVSPAALCLHAQVKVMQNQDYVSNSRH